MNSARSVRWVVVAFALGTLAGLGWQRTHSRRYKQHDLQPQSDLTPTSMQQLCPLNPSELLPKPSLAGVHGVKALMAHGLAITAAGGLHVPRVDRRWARHRACPRASYDKQGDHDADTPSNNSHM